jgi:hypothetical protein
MEVVLTKKDDLWKTPHNKTKRVELCSSIIHPEIKYGLYMIVKKKIFPYADKGKGILFCITISQR